MSNTSSIIDNFNRNIEAKRFWDIGVGRELGLSSFEAYLATIPQAPAELVLDDADYPLLVLVEPRVGLKRLCSLGGIEFSGDGETFVQYDQWHHEFVQPSWIRVQDGRKNRNRAARNCRVTFAEDELGLTALQGVCTYLHHPDAVTDTDREDGHAMSLSGSVHRDNHVRVASLKLWRGGAKLRWDFDGHAVPKYGSASRREYKSL